MKKLLVCTNFHKNPNQPSCAARGSKTLASNLAIAIQESELPIVLEQTDCLGFCNIGVNLRLSPNGEFIHHADNTEQSQVNILLAIKIFTHPKHG